MTETLLKFQPTKTWLRSHKHRPPECGCSDCICILDHFRNNHQGFCVGFYSKNGDLDMVSLCWIAWNKETTELERQNALMHPEEANSMALHLNLAVTELWEMIPEYRKQIGNMARKRTRDIKKADGREQKG